MTLRPGLQLAALVTLGAALGAAATAAQTPSFARGPKGGRSGEAPPLRHNPIFGLGPQTIWRGGVGIGLEGEVTRATGSIEAMDRALHAELLYGVTEDLTVALALPLAQRKSERTLAPGVSQVNRDATGVGDALLRGKWRFFQRFRGATQYHAALIAGVKAPLASTSS
ncbi:MAG: hypothetical protein ACE5PT_11600, partial [Gemmatimonadales bacterium]